MLWLVTEVSRFFRVPKEHIAFIRAIVEAHEGLCVVRSRDADRGEIELMIPEACLSEAEGLVHALGRRTGWVEIPRPADWT